MGVAERRINIRKNSRNPMRNKKNIVPLQSILLENIFCKVFKMLLPLLVREDEERFFCVFIVYSLFFILYSCQHWHSKARRFFKPSKGLPFA